MAKHHSKHKHLAKSSGRDKHAHASHHHMNKHHGTPKGFDAAEAYSDDVGAPGSYGHMAPSMTEEHYEGSEGPGVPGGMQGNYSNEGGGSSPSGDEDDGE